MHLSVIIITYNEERNIERCLKSVLGIADEIVVVDSFSTDQTERICLQYGVKIIQRKFDGYGTQKQFAANQAKFEYVLSLDADEELSEALRGAILIEKEKWAHTCYSFNRKNFYCNVPIRFCGWYPDKQVRLFNRLKTNWDNKSVHESIDIQNKREAFHLHGDLNHYTCYSITEHQEKEKKYARINADTLIKEGKHVYLVTPYIKSAFRFLKTYIIKLGILDGYYGLIISKTLAKSSYYKYTWARKQS
ncbi:MAG: glycosyltransferase family 2 protein [Bacteroidota bacterium]|nr:glycosyltransferase family 2 protein [Bacteroidota bacterium]